MIDSTSSIPELIEFLKPSFRECEYDEVQGILVDREKTVKIEMENLVRERDELKKQVEFLETSKGYTELEKCNLEEKLGRSERIGEELDKKILQMSEKFEKLRNEKTVVEEKLVRSSEKFGEMDEMMVEMGKEIEELRREKLSATKTIEELKVKGVEVDRVAQELKREIAEALHTIEELRVKKLKSDKAVGFYENDLDPRISKLERTLANLLSVNVEDLPCLAKEDGFAAETEGEAILRNGEVNLEEEEDMAIVLREAPAISGGEVPTQKTVLVPPSHATGNVVIVIDDSDSDSEHETSVPDTSSGQINTEDRTDSSEDSLMSAIKRRKLSSSATPSHCSWPRRVEERVDGVQQPRTVDFVDSTDSDDELISDDHMNNLVATCESKVRSRKAGEQSKGKEKVVDEKTTHTKAKGKIKDVDQNLKEKKGLCEP
ncbi:myosin heavy chain, non-muscle-like [Salvia divinorum]|uniref:Myosin heavy chain, non-muscle-like n=1 Tax=Salvia divinorum TaxID=28513 RepID=A0ABD1IPM1_SALDI